MSHSPSAYFCHTLSILDTSSHWDETEFVLMRIHSPFCDLHSLFEKSIGRSCSPQWNYGNMRDDDVLVITTAWPSHPAASWCFMDGVGSALAKSFISFYVGCSQKLSVQHQLYLQSISELLTQSLLVMQLLLKVLWQRTRIMLCIYLFFSKTHFGQLMA